MNFLERPMLKIIQRKIVSWFDLERAQAKKYGGIEPTDGSPEKSWPDPEKIPSGNEIPFTLKNIFIVGKYLKSTISESMKALQSLEDNPSTPKTEISPEKLKEFEQYAKSLGIGAIGYAKLPAHLIFKDRAALYDNAIVLLKEMDKEKIAKKIPIHGLAGFVKHVDDAFAVVLKTQSLINRLFMIQDEKLISSGKNASLIL
jgi:epoxyqueuosine reductase